MVEKHRPLVVRRLSTSRIHQSFRPVLDIGHYSWMRWWRRKCCSSARIQHCRSSCFQTRHRRGSRQLRDTPIGLRQRSRDWAVGQK